MEKYVLLSDEVLLFEDQVNIKGIKAKTNLILTNLFFVIEITQKIGFMKHETIVEQYSVEDIKYYNEKQQIIQKKDTVTLYFSNKEMVISFDSFFAASKFANKANEAVTGNGIATRGAGVVKKTIGLVDDTLGINLVGTAAGVIENGVAKTLFKGIGKQGKSQTNQSNSTDTISAVANATSTVVKSIKEPNGGNEAEKSYEQHIEEVKKLKELLDIGAISQEEFDSKKKELLGL